MMYKSVEIKRDEKYGTYQFISPLTGTLKVFSNMNRVMIYIDWCEKVIMEGV